jgi:hypothetical protein
MKITADSIRHLARIVRFEVLLRGLRCCACIPAALLTLLLLAEPASAWQAPKGRAPLSGRSGVPSRTPNPSSSPSARSGQLPKRSASSGKPAPMRKNYLVLGRNVKGTVAPVRDAINATRRGRHAYIYRGYLGRTSDQNPNMKRQRAARLRHLTTRFDRLHFALACRGYMKQGLTRERAIAKVRAQRAELRDGNAQTHKERFLNACYKGHNKRFIYRACDAVSKGKLVIVGAVRDSNQRLRIARFPTTGNTRSDSQYVRMEEKVVKWHKTGERHRSSVFRTRDAEKVVKQMQRRLAELRAVQHGKRFGSGH